MSMSMSEMVQKDIWHKLAFLLVKRAGGHVLITTQEVSSALSEDIKDNNVVVYEDEYGLHLQTMTLEQAINKQSELAAKEAKNETVS